MFSVLAILKGIFFVFQNYVGFVITCVLDLIIPMLKKKWWAKNKAARSWKSRDLTPNTVPHVLFSTTFILVSSLKTSDFINGRNRQGLSYVEERAYMFGVCGSGLPVPSLPFYKWKYAVAYFLFARKIT